MNSWYYDNTIINFLELEKEGNIRARFGIKIVVKQENAFKSSITRVLAPLEIQS